MTLLEADSEGFAAGDRVLVAVAAGLRRAERQAGGTACRLSGRRFALVVPSADEPAAQAAADDLATELVPGPPCEVWAVAWREGEDGHALVDRARDGLAALTLARAAPSSGRHP